MTISPEHEQKVLLPRGITAAQAEAHGVRSILDPSELPEEFAGSRYAVGSGLLFPWKSPLAGTVWQFRPDEPIANPQGDPVKYVFPNGQQMVLNRLRDSGDGPVMLQEGTLQSIAAVSYAHEGWNIYGMSGCWSWRRGETTVAIPDLLVMEGRDVVVSLDADAATNLDVYNAGLALFAALEAEGAHTITFLRLDGAGSKAGLDDVLGARPMEARSSYLNRALTRTSDKPAPARPTKKSKGSTSSLSLTDPNRPVIVVNDDRREVINGLTSALKAKGNGTTLFGYGGILAQRTEATVQPVTKGVFADLVADAALTVTVSAKGDATPQWPDEKTMDAVLSRADSFATLERISQVPFVRPDGSVCQTPGYDEATATYLVLDEAVERVTVPEEPSEDEVRWAVKLLTEEWLGDLFAIMPEPEDRANCLAMVLTPLIRGLVPLAPMAVVDGLQMGVGKNLLADLLAIIATGHPAAPLPYSRDDDENRKIITASFRAGQELLVFDEAHVIEGRHLARSITGITYSDRILGVSNMIEFPNRVTWVALGNNVSVNGDLARRVYRIRLAPAMENPQDRDSGEFRHPDIKGWTVEHRAELIGAALTLIRAWFIGERIESPSGRRFGSFEAWGGMVGGILDNAGVEGFLGSLVEWRSETDYETTFWTDHLAWLSAQFGTGDFTVSDVVAKMRRANHVEHPPRLEDHTVTGYNRLLGLAYGRVKNRVMNGLQLVRTVETAGHGNRWTVRDRRPTTPATAPAKTADVTEGDSVVTGDTVDRVDSLLALRDENSLTYSVRACSTDFSGGTGIRIYPLYPNYPSADGDPLASLLSFCSPVPDRICPDCDTVETLTPSGFWYACAQCSPETFRPREGCV